MSFRALNLNVINKRKFQKIHSSSLHCIIIIIIIIIIVNIIIIELMVMQPTKLDIVSCQTEINSKFLVFFSVIVQQFSW